jgi:nucleoside-diphosphate-sugar epimerase
MSENLGDGEGVVLFGGSGFLGPYILERYPRMVSVGRTPPRTANRHIHVPSLADLSALEREEFDRVIYIVGSTDHHAMDRDSIPRGEPTAFDYHVVPLYQALEQVKGRRLRKFIAFSTSLVYDEARIKLPVDEQAPINPYKSRYVMSKWMGEELCRFYSSQVPIVIVRMANLYGPTPLHRYDLVHVTCRQLLEQGRADVWSTRPARDFIYVTDAADAIAKLLCADHTGLVLLGSGTMTSVAKVIDLLRDLSGCPIDVLDQPVSGAMEFRADTRLLRSLIDWEPRVGIEEGVRLTWEGMRKVYAERGDAVEAVR